ncbi:MAG: hypothetical protein M5U25_02790 [Planctomycetota bacterium]|nr:hypothetical protein [Planctomycetota bacterium]
MKLKQLCAAMAAAALLVVFAAPSPRAQEKETPKVEKEDAKPAVSQEVRRKEGENLLRSLRDQARVSYAKTGSAPETLTGSVEKSGCGADAESIKGDYCKLHDKVYVVDEKNAALIAEDFSGGDGFAVLEFKWASGESKITWYDTLEALKEAHKDLKIEDKSTEADKKDDKKDEAGDTDPWATYRKEGRNWTYETAGGFTMKTTVKNVTEDGCDLENQAFMNGNALTEPTIVPLKFTKPEDVPDARVDTPKPIEKNVECKAGKYDCISYDDGKTWMMKKYPGIVVKAASLELIEFNE